MKEKSQEVDEPQLASFSLSGSLPIPGLPPSILGNGEFRRSRDEEVRRIRRDPLFFKETLIVAAAAITLVVGLTKIHAYIAASILLIYGVIIFCVLCFKDEFLLYKLDEAFTRPINDSGFMHGCLLGPLVLASKYYVAFALESPDSDYLFYNFVLTILFGFSLLYNISIDRNTRPSLFVFILFGVISLTLFQVHLYFEGSVFRIIHTSLGIIGYQISLYAILRICKQNFTLGEGSIIAQMIVLMALDFIVASCEKFQLIELPSTMIFPRTEVYIFLLALILGMLAAGVILSPVLIQIKNSFEKSKKPTNQETSEFLGNKPRVEISTDHLEKASSPENFPNLEKNEGKIWGYPLKNAFLSGIFWLGGIIIVFGFISPWVQAFLIDNPFLWTFNFILEDSKRSLLCLFWLFSVILSVIFFNLRGINQQVFGKSSKIPLILVRKYFHLLAIVMFVPGYLYQPLFQQLAFGVSLSIMILCEYIRFFDVFPFGVSIGGFLITFVDSRDSGPVILSHLYLLLGCALPIWLSSIPTTSFFAGFSGILILGIGDTMASIIGVRFGKHKWKGTSKSIEGTLAGIISMLILSFFLYQLCPSEQSLSFLQWGFVIFGLSLSGLLEAFTLQNDNLVVPLYLFAILNLIIME